MPDISVVVCTFNRAALLRGALESLATQSLDPKIYEIVVVDNGSTDETQATVDAFKRKHPGHHVVSVRETQQGLAHARNTGMRCSRGRYIAYIDDDARADRKWLEVGVRLVEELEPMCIGGKVIPVYEAKKPSWYKDGYETRTWGPSARFLSKRESFSGSNMIWSRSVLERFGGFDVRVGVKGPHLGLGEETALFNRIWDSVENPTFFYSPELIVYHMVPAWKMTISYQLKRRFSWGQSWYLIYGPRSTKERRKLLRSMMYSVFRKTLTAVGDVQEYPCYHEWVVERIGPIAGEIGKMTECIGFRLTVRQG